MLQPYRKKASRHITKDVLTRMQNARLFTRINVMINVAPQRLNAVLNSANLHPKSRLCTIKI